MQVLEKSEKMIKVLHYYNLIDDIGLMEKFKIVCPFHGDVNASLQINLDTGSFYCYGCGKSGDYKDFVKNIEVALQTWKDKKSIPRPESANKKPFNKHKKQ